MLTFEEYIEDQQFIHLGGETYECPGLHIWHEDEIKKQYEEYVEEYKKKAAPCIK